jgi:tripartite-type tricarboxylate transporter receptor subunit TctC
MSRVVAAACAVLTVIWGAPAATAQTYPAKQIRFLQGFPAGGNADILTRVLGDELSKALGQTVIVEARPGATGNLATEQIVRAAPDGHSLVLLTTAHVISPALLKVISFDPIKDVAFITKVADYPFFIAVHGSSPYKSLKELVDAARAKPDGLTWGSAGTGSGQHMGGETLALESKIKVRHVPFRGDAGSVTALLSKSVDYIVAPSTVLISNIEAGTFRALAITAKTRADSLPNVPTMSEVLGADIEMQAFASVATTKGTPPAVIERLNKELHTIIAKPAIAKRIRELGGVPAPTTAAGMTSFADAQVKRWKKVVEAAGIKSK